MTNHRKLPDLAMADKQKVAQFLIANNTKGKINKGKVKEAAASFGVCPLTIQNIWAAAKEQDAEGKPIIFKSNKKGKTLRKLVIPDLERLKKVKPHLRGSIRNLADEMGYKKSTVHRRLKIKQIKRHSNAVKPSLTEVHKFARMKYSLNALEVHWPDTKVVFKTMHNVVHVDEKWFYLFKEKENVYMAPDEEDQYRHCKNKHYIPKVMFLCAVSRPIEADDGTIMFDGKVGMWPLTEKVPAQRTSINRPRGTSVTRPLPSINKDVTRKFYVEQVIPAIKAKWPANASKTIYIQQDNAPAHISDMDPLFTAAASSDGFNIHIINQPACSPDTNVNDLGWFRSPQSLKVDRRAANIDQLIENVTTSFVNITASTLNNVFLSLQNCMIEILKVKGNNTYKLPHMGMARLRRQGLLPKTLEVDEVLIRESIEYLMEHEESEGSSYDNGELLLHLGY